MTELKDWRGTPLGVGSRIIYPGRQSSSLWVTEAVVEEVRVKEHPWRRGEIETSLKVQPVRTTGYNNKPRSVVLTEISRVTVL